MDLIDTFIVLGSDRSLLATLLVLLIAAFGLFIASLPGGLPWPGSPWARRSLPFHWKRVAVFLSLTSVGLLFLAALILMNALSSKEKPEEDARERLESIDIPEIDEEIRRGRNANRSSLE